MFTSYFTRVLLYRSERIGENKDLKHWRKFPACHVMRVQSHHKAKEGLTKHFFVHKIAFNLFHNFHIKAIYTLRRNTKTSTLWINRDLNRVS